MLNHGQLDRIGRSLIGCRSAIPSRGSLGVEGSTWFRDKRGSIVFGVSEGHERIRSPMPYCSFGDRQVGRQRHQQIGFFLDCVCLAVSPQTSPARENENNNNSAGGSAEWQCRESRSIQQPVLIPLRLSLSCRFGTLPCSFLNNATPMCMLLLQRPFPPFLFLPINDTMWESNHAKENHPRVRCVEAVTEPAWVVTATNFSTATTDPIRSESR